MALTPQKTSKKAEEPVQRRSPTDWEPQRRARNRQSQRLFRERRTLRIQELEARIEYLSMGEAERNASLVSTNSALKAALIRARQQCLHIEMVLGSLNMTLSNALGLPGNQPGPQGSEPAVETTAYPNPESPSLTISHITQESIGRQAQSPLDSGLSEMSGPNVRASPLRLNQDAQLSICDFMDYDLAVPSLPESFSIHSQSMSPPSMDTSPSGKSKTLFGAFGYFHMSHGVKSSLVSIVETCLRHF
jgi:hypothetical protein